MWLHEGSGSAGWVSDRVVTGERRTSGCWLSSADSSGVSSRGRHGGAGAAGLLRWALVLLLAGSLLAVGCSGGSGDDSVDEASSEDSAGDSPALGNAIDGGTDGGDPYVPDAGATGYDVEHYDMALGWDPIAGRLTGTATISLVPDELLRSFSLDLDGLRVTGLRVDDQEATWEREGIDLVVTPADPLPEGATAEVQVDYRGSPHLSSSLQSLGESGWIEQGDVALATGQPSGTATWIPINDVLTDKATWSFAIEVPRGLAAASNGVLSSRRRSGGTTTWSWSVDEPMTPSLATVVIGPFTVDEDRGPHGLPLLSFYGEGVDPSLFDSTARMVRVLEDWFGPYPFSTYGVIVPAVSLDYALETQTRSLLATVDPTGFDVREVVQVHELAHQWFGDSVTPDAWADIWLNEGFATYAEYLWQDETEPEFDLERTMTLLRDGDVQGPILDPGPRRMFDNPVYFRGALTLHALRGQMGDDAFFALLRTWADQHRFGSVTTDDFVALAEDLAGQPLNHFFDTWLSRRRLPPP